MLRESLISHDGHRNDWHEVMLCLVRVLLLLLLRRESSGSLRDLLLGIVVGLLILTSA